MNPYQQVAIPAALVGLSLLAVLGATWVYATSDDR